jgi:hypothetical protein
MENNLFLLGSVFITFIAAVLALAFARQNQHPAVDRFLCQPIGLGL